MSENAAEGPCGTLTTVADGRMAVLLIREENLKNLHLLLSSSVEKYFSLEE